ncbi:MAG: Ni/Fe hydrogenase subunit alpha [Methanobacteriota archaeon]
MSEKTVEIKNSKQSNKIIEVNYIARVEGRGALNISVSKDGIVEDLRFRVYEPPRFFESFLIGRKYNEVMELTSRICGICPVAHQITSLRAVENAIGLEPSEQTVDLRKLMAISAHIQSNVLSMYFLSLPDLLGYESAIAMVKDHLPVVKRGLKLKQLGNDITDLVGGRAVHPVTAVVGGFTALPSRNRLQIIRKRLADAKQDALDTVDLFSKVKIPNFVRKCEHIALSDQTEYAINDGRLRSTEGLNIHESEYRDYISEEQVLYSTALHSHVKTRGPFMVGPLPRVNLNFGQLSSDAKDAAKRSGVKFPNFNPFVSHLARAIEVVHDIDESIEIIDRLQLKEERRDIGCKAGFGAAITEAPRGSLYHSFVIDNSGVVRKADIVPPTAHNANNIERDLHELVGTMLDRSIEEIKFTCEMLVRAYDPCISCSTH